MSEDYQPEGVSRYFDEYGLREWNRLVETPVGEVSLYIHSHYLKKHLLPGARVLEIGAGAGRFTQILAELGARILVADISPGQLELNKHHASVYGFSQAVEAWEQVDICDMSRFSDASFDNLVAYGGPLSYVLDKRDTALSECVRVLKPGSLLFLSVMSLWGSAHGFLDGVISLPLEANRTITRLGDITSQTFPGRESNFMHMFRVGELRHWLARAGLEILELSASGCLSLVWKDLLTKIRADPQKWEELLEFELDASADEGCLGMGTHLICVTRKR